MPESISQQLCIPASHPCLAGHFPGNPIVPGVVILEAVRQLLLQWRPGSRISSIAQAKFHLPLRPDEVCTLTLTRMEADSFKFTCRKDALTLVSGLFSIKQSS